MSRRTTAVAVTGALVAAGLLTACGGGTGGSKTTAPPTTAAAAAKSTTTPHQVTAPPTKTKPKPKPKTLAHGAQHGLTGCIISYKDAQKGPGSSTFSTLVLDSSGKPYSPTGSPYDVMLQLSMVGDDGTEYPVSEALGHGSRTAADNIGGSDWFTTNQGLVEVSANSTEGMVISTLQISLAQVKRVEGNILITSENDENYLKQMDCAVRPA